MRHTEWQAMAFVGVRDERDHPVVGDLDFARLRGRAARGAAQVEQPSTGERLDDEVGGGARPLRRVVDHPLEVETLVRRPSQQDAARRVRRDRLADGHPPDDDPGLLVAEPAVDTDVSVAGPRADDARLRASAQLATGSVKAPHLVRAGAEPDGGAAPEDPVLPVEAVKVRLRDPAHAPAHRDGANGAGVDAGRDPAERDVEVRPHRLEGGTVEREREALMIRKFAAGERHEGREPVALGGVADAVAHVDTIVVGERAKMGEQAIELEVTVVVRLDEPVPLEVACPTQSLA
jgi:hypothetical protein